jgi:hypothetical protein
MRELATKIIKKVSLEIIYDAVEDRTGEIKSDITELKAKQEKDFRYLNDKVDTLGRELRQDIGQVRQEIGQTNQRIDSLSQKTDTQAGQVNQRLDTVMQMLVELSKQVVELSKQK